MIKKLRLLCLFTTLSIFTVKAQSTSEYITEHAEQAQELMREHKIPASIILAVAIHESAAGQSKIARYLNNHFGIKGPNTNTEISSSYRDYPTSEDSYIHFIDLLESRTAFSPLFEKYDQYNYRAWAKGIQRGGYARSRTWATQVVNIIKRYELFQYDERPEDYIEPAAPVSTRKPAARSRRYYTVRSGDNLGAIAKRNHTTIKTLMNKNGLKNSRLKPGQKLKL